MGRSVGFPEKGIKNGMNKPKIPQGMNPIPGVKFYNHWDEETRRSYLTEVMDDMTERFCCWLPPDFSWCIEELIKAGKFGDVKTYRL